MNNPYDPTRPLDNGSGGQSSPPLVNNNPFGGSSSSYGGNPSNSGINNPNYNFNPAFQQQNSPKVGYQPVVYMQPVARQPRAAEYPSRSNGMAIAGLVLGIVGLVFSIVALALFWAIYLTYVAFFLVSPALVFSIIAMTRGTRKGMSITALILSALGMTILLFPMLACAGLFTL